MSNVGNKETVYVTVGKAAILTGLDSQTIRKMADKSKILCYRTPSGQRRINLQNIQEMCSNNLHGQKEHSLQKANFIYARVSTKKQMDDLSRQVEFLRRPEYNSYVLIQDICSGINFKRKGLATILDACLQNNIGDIVIAHRDRLCRFGFELIESLVTKAGGKITILDCSKEKTSEQELTEDLLSIIHVFSCRQMGKRSYSGQKNKIIQNNSNQVIPIQETKTVAG
jgi:predicted site-specific integrase-resolvase